MPQVRLLQAGFESFTGIFGRFEFKDGVSVDNLSTRDAEFLAANCHIESVDGDDLNPANYLYTHRNKEATVEVEAEAEVEAGAEIEADSKETLENQEVTIENVNKDSELQEALDIAVKVEHEASQQSILTESDVKNIILTNQSEPSGSVIHTKESLGKVADKKGIAGLRDIGDPLGVVSNSIPKLIDKILEAQSKNKG